MTHTHIPLRLALSVLLVASSFPELAHAQGGPDVTFELRPHCIDQERIESDTTFGGEVPDTPGITRPLEQSAISCPEFAVRDPLSRQTDILKIGDTLDMDLILHNPSGRPLTRYRAWIGYDSTVLSGATLTLSDAFPVQTPGEADFSTGDNYVKLSGTSTQPVTGTKIVLARIIVTIKAAPAVGTALSFYDPSGTETAHTAAFIRDGDQEVNVASNIQGSLAVRLQTVTSSSSSIASSIASVSSVSSVAASSAASVAPTVFTKLQVQSLRVTTEGSSAFLAWNPLPSAELAGYNLYYGSISGRYLQRRSVDDHTQTITIRALPVGQTYYFAVRAVNGSGQESDFSQEVAVTIGNPATSTSPLSGALIEGGPQGNAPGTGGNVAGESGPASWMLLFAAASAVMGTLLAFRRQWTARSALLR